MSWGPEETVLHDVGIADIRPGDEFWIEGKGDVPNRATALTPCSIVTQPDGRVQHVLMVQIPGHHRFENLMRPDGA